MPASQKVKPTPAQLRYLRLLTDRTGSSTYPASFDHARREITRMEKMMRDKDEEIRRGVASRVPGRFEVAGVASALS